MQRWQEVLIENAPHNALSESKRRADEEYFEAAYVEHTYERP